MAYDLLARIDRAGPRLDQISPSDMESVEYRQGPVRIPDLRVRLARVKLDELGWIVPISQGIRQDFVVSASLLRAAGIDLPREGDVIRRANGETYRVGIPAEGLACYSWITHSRVRMRIHSVQVTP